MIQTRTVRRANVGVEKRTLTLENSDFILCLTREFSRLKLLGRARTGVPEISSVGEKSLLEAIVSVSNVSIVTLHSVPFIFATS